MRNIEGELDWGVWVRRGASGNWTPWRDGKIVARVFPEEDWEFSLEGGDPQDKDVPLGVFPEAIRTENPRTVQFLIRWVGYCSVEGLKLDSTAGDVDDGQTTQVDQPIVRLEVLSNFDYDDFENASDDNRWEATPDP